MPDPSFSPNSSLQPAGRIALLTGATGQDGTYLTELLHCRGYHVWGLVRDSSLARSETLKDQLQEAEPGNIRLVMGDLADSRRLREILDQIQPHEIYHLGSQSQVQASFLDPEGTGNVTGLGTVRILEAMHTLHLPARLFNASSSEIFGNAAGPLNEEAPIRPRNPYGAAKAYAHQMTRIYREHHGLFAANGILFNHESPRRGAAFVSRKITSTLARILAGQQVRLTLGNLDAQRDWGFAGDYVEGMWRTLQGETPRDYVFSTGKTHSVRDFCSAAFACAGLPLLWRGQGLEETGQTEDGRILVSVDPRYFRPEATSRIFGDSSRARMELGWQPTVRFADLVQMMVDHDRECLRIE